MTNALKHAAAAFLLVPILLGVPAEAAEPEIPDGAIRIATFNAALTRDEEGALLNDLENGNDPQAAAVAEIIQRVRPDILILQEIDRDPEGGSLDLFHENYLAVGQNGAEPINYAHAVFPESNTGERSGLDLNNDGEVGGPNDAFGFGNFPGQYAFAVLSRYPIDEDQMRSFRTFPWKDLPGAKLPVDPDSGEPYYAYAEQSALRLSSKNHVDVPIEISGETIHILASHPTPPVFDGPEDRNGLRNRDEIRFWSVYLDPEAVVTDDAGTAGGLPVNAFAVIAGDMNADPVDGDSTGDPISALLEHPRVNGFVAPRSEGSVEAAASQGAANALHEGDPATDTADFSEGDNGPGNLRVDYVLPTRNLDVVGSGVFWPAPSDPLARLTGSGWPVVSSDHRLVFIDVRFAD